MPDHFVDLLHQNVGDLSRIQPAIMVIATFLLAMVFDFAVPADKRRNTGYICIIGLLIAAWLNVIQNDAFNAFLVAHEKPHKLSIFSGMLVYDHFGTFFNFIILIGTILSLLLAIGAKELEGKNQGEFFLLLVAVCAGGMFLASATNLLMIYLSLESLSIVSYAMAGYLRRDRKSAEAGIKYVIYGAMASGIMIFGMSYLYGLTGTLNLFGDKGIASQLVGFESASETVGRGGIAAVLAMVFAGFLYKIAAVPFHYWSPDVYEGAPTTATGFFSVVPKAAGFAVLIRVLVAFFPIGDSSNRWLSNTAVEHIVGVIAVLTMTIGNLAALGQTNAKRMLAYSSIAHAGYMLAGLSVLDTIGGPAAVLFYLVVYLFMNLGAFVVLIALENIFGSTDLSRLRGAVRREPVLCVALCIFLFSLTGLPPLAGFMGKYLIMVRLATRNHFGMVFWIGINSVISLYYYMRMAKAVAIDSPPENEPVPNPGLRSSSMFTWLAILHSAALILLFFKFEWLQSFCRYVMSPLVQG